MANIFTSATRYLIGDRLYDHLFYRHHHLRLLHEHGLPNRRLEGEAEYLRLWHSLSHLVDPLCYRLYRPFFADYQPIVPTDLLTDIVEPALNPPEYWAVYEDKNMFHRFVDPTLLPLVVAQRIGGGRVLMRQELSRLDMPLILKPSAGSSCGDGVMRFDRVGEHYQTSYGARLDARFLQAYGDDFVLQQAVAQHPALARLCHSALSTIRLCVYRSVLDDEVHVTGAVLRIGREGGVVDNIVAGGRFMGLDVATGRATTPFIGRDGLRTDVWNGVDHRQADIAVPGWGSVLQVAQLVADGIPHHHLLSLDVAVQPNEKPMLIEYNIGGFSSYMFHFSGQSLFGPYTGEVIDWVRQRARH